MALISSLIFYVICILIFFGQLARFSFGTISFPIIDITLVLFVISQFLSKNIHLKKGYIIFFLFLVFGNIINSSKLHLIPTISWLYLIRLLSLLTLLFSPPKLNTKQLYFLDLFLLANLIFGFVQYLFFPDLTAFSEFNWDPHLYRLVSTFFDPTFTGIIYLFLFLRFFFSQSKYRTFILILAYLGIALTYSRSTLLSFIIVFLFIAIKNKIFKYIIYSILLVIFTIILLPRFPGEGTKLERSSSILAKIENYQEGFNLYKNAPIIGLGYNHLSYLRSNATSHSNAGFDGSLLNILITSGLIGLSMFLFLLIKDFSHQNILYQSCLVGLLCHSLFANSLFYPFVTLILIFFKNRKLL